MGGRGKGKREGRRKGEIKGGRWHHGF